MGVQVKGDKLLRLSYIITNQSDRQRFIEKLKEAYTDATKIDVTDIGGLRLEYKPSFGNKSRNPLRIPKSVVEEFNVDLLDDDPEADVDALDTLKAQLDHWIELCVNGSAVTGFTNTDFVELITFAGPDNLRRFIYNVGKDALIDTTVIARQNRFSNVRTDIATKIQDTTDPDAEIKVVDGVVIVNTLVARDIISALLTVVGNEDIPEEPEVDDFENPHLFYDDIELPVTHFKNGRTYIAKICPFALDYYGQIEFKVEIEEEVEDPDEGPEDPEPPQEPDPEDPPAEP